MKSLAISLSTKKQYGLKRVCQVWEIPRSTVYGKRKRESLKATKQKPGPKPKIADSKILDLICQDLEASPFHGEGHRKVHARLRNKKGIIVGRERVRKIMGENRLLSPYRSHQGTAKKHDGRITTDQPNVLWGTDAAKIFTSEDGWIWFFGVIEHWNAECMGWHLSKRGDRFAALEPLKMAMESEYGSLGRGAAHGLSLRSDHGSQYRSNEFIEQVKFWGITPSFGFVREPETNGVIERFNRTLKEQVIYGQIYKTIGELEIAIRAFVETYNEEWLLAKLNYQSPREARRVLRGKTHAA